MYTISVNYTLEYELNFATNYKWTQCGKCFNVKTGRRIKKSYNTGCLDIILTVLLSR